MDPAFIGLRHVALNVRNVRQSIQFYSSVLGMSLEWMPDEENAYLTSGGDNLAATFSTELADLTIYVIDVAEGEKIPRKGGPGITRSDFLVINKIDLAPLVGANLEVMKSDTIRMRGQRPFVFSNLKSGEGVDQIVGFIVGKGGLTSSAA